MAGDEAHDAEVRASAEAAEGEPSSSVRELHHVPSGGRGLALRGLRGGTDLRVVILVARHSGVRAESQKNFASESTARGFVGRVSRFSKYFTLGNP